jgi:hypothetical protein
LARNSDFLSVLDIFATSLKNQCDTSVVGLFVNRMIEIFVKLLLESATKKKKKKQEKGL